MCPGHTVYLVTEFDGDGEEVVRAFSQEVHARRYIEDSGYSNLEVEPIEVLDHPVEFVTMHRREGVATLKTAEMEWRESEASGIIMVPVPLVQIHVHHLTPSSRNVEKDVHPPHPEARLATHLVSRTGLRGGVSPELDHIVNIVAFGTDEEKVQQAYKMGVEEAKQKIKEKINTTC